MRDIRIPGIRRVLRISLSPRDVDNEVAEEIRFHLNARTAELVRAGLAESEARERARMEFGDIEQSTQELTRVDRRRVGHDNREERFMSFRDDIRYAVRSLARRPAFLLVITLTLSLGIAANAIMFGVVDELLLRAPMHVVAPDQVRRINFRDVERAAIGSGRSGAIDIGSRTTYPVLTALRANTAAFSDLAAYNAPWPYSVGQGREALTAPTQLVSGNYFRLLGVQPALGRVFADADDRIPVGEAVVMISYGMWQRQYGGDSSVVGRKMILQGKPFTIVGVAPRGFSGIDRAKVDVWVPISAIALESLGEGWYNTANNWWAQIIGRVGIGFTPEVATAQATAAYRGIVREWNEPMRDTTSSIVMSSVIATRTPNGLSRESKVSLWLMGVSAMVLLIACANVANLLLVRTIERRREIAVRIAMGVRRSRLVRMLLTETALLALLASSVAFVIAFAAGSLVRNVLMPSIVWSDAAFDGRVFAFTLVTAIVCMLLAGLVPALQGLRLNVVEGLKASSRSVAGGPGRLRFALLLTQTAMSAVLLVGAGLFVQSLRNVVTRETGIDRDRVLRVTMPLSRFGFDSAQVEDVYQRGADRLRAIPGVASVSVVRMTYPMGGATSTEFSVPGVAEPEISGGGPYNSAITSGYFATMGARIVKGRDFSPAEERRGARVLIVNEKLARAYWPKGDAVGSCAKFGLDSTCSEVIGIVGNMLQFNLVNDDRAMVYAPPRHPGVGGAAPAAIMLRVSRDANSLVPIIRREIQSLAATMPYVEVKAFTELVAPQMQPWRMSATMFTLFGVIALVMAAVGLYSVMAYWVSQRSQEIGVRMALGAQRLDVVRLVAMQSSRAVVAGLLLGGVVAWVVSRYAIDLLYETSPNNLAVYAGAAAVLMVAGIIASIVPARRSVGIDPAQAMRGE